jgi:hypothetical protein
MVSAFYSRYEFVLGPVGPVGIGETFYPSHIVVTLITGRVIKLDSSGNVYKCWLRVTPQEMEN